MKYHYSKYGRHHIHVAALVTFFAGCAIQLLRWLHPATFHAGFSLTLYSIAAVLTLLLLVESND